MISSVFSGATVTTCCRHQRWLILDERPPQSAAFRAFRHSVARPASTIGLRYPDARKPLNRAAFEGPSGLGWTAIEPLNHMERARGAKHGRVGRRIKALIAPGRLPRKRWNRRKAELWSDAPAWPSEQVNTHRGIAMSIACRLRRGEASLSNAVHADRMSS